MRVKLEFGSYDGIEIVSWYREISDFPKLLRYMGNIYEFAMYQPDSTMQNDYIFNFSLTRDYKTKYYEIASFNDMFRVSFGDGCQCGAKFDKGNPGHHMFYCSKWKPKESK